MFDLRGEAVLIYFDGQVSVQKTKGFVVFYMRERMVAATKICKVCFHSASSSVIFYANIAWFGKRRAYLIVPFSRRKIQGQEALSLRGLCW